MPILTEVCVEKTQVREHAITSVLFCTKWMNKDMVWHIIAKRMHGENEIEARAKAESEGPGVQMKQP
jgi:hypothetical protein